MMKAKDSPLQIVDIAITSFEFELILKSTNENPYENFTKYSLDIDFDISINTIIRVAIKASINRGEEKLAGYSLKAEAICFFKLNNDSIANINVKRNLEGFSTIYIALNSLRGLISNFTANAPFGRYILPSIDLNDLIEQKRNAVDEKKKDITKSKKKVNKIDKK